MDPQKLSQLDPKLREAYQRVMGTSVPDPTPTPQPIPQPYVPSDKPNPIPADTSIPPIAEPAIQPPAKPQPVLLTEPPAIPTPEPAPTIQEPSPIPAASSIEPAPAIPQPAEPQPAIDPQPQDSNFTQMNSEVAAAAPTAGNLNFTAPIQTQTLAVKKKHGSMPILFGIVGLIFIVVYALFWAKIFNIKLPFLG